jgi:glutamine synthetase
MENREKLQKVSEEFTSGTFFTPVVGAEVEFYFVSKERHCDEPTSREREEAIFFNCNEIASSCSLQSIHRNDDLIAKIQQSCVHLSLFDVKKEEGNGQYEVALLHSQDVCGLSDRIMQVRAAIGELAEELGARADFSAKPFADDYGNSLHIHISLLDKNGKNPFEKQGDSESDIMLYAIGGLLTKMPESMPVFAPYPACYDRLKGGKDAPATISWGGNNRTVALRLPTTTTEPHNRRIEHRVAAADADPYLVIAAILEAVRYGIENKIMPESEKIYGDAGLEVYGLQSILAH